MGYSYISKVNLDSNPTATAKSIIKINNRLTLLRNFITQKHDYDTPAATSSYHFSDLERMNTHEYKSLSDFKVELV